MNQEESETALQAYLSGWDPDEETWDLLIENFNIE